MQRCVGASAVQILSHFMHMSVFLAVRLFRVVSLSHVQLLLDREGTLTLVGLEEMSLAGDLAPPVFAVALDMLGF